MIRYFLLSATLSCILFTSCTKQESSGHQGYPQTPAYEKAPQIPIDTNLVEGVMLAERVSYNYSEESNNGDTWVWFYDKDHSSYLRMDTLTFNGHEGDDVLLAFRRAFPYLSTEFISCHGWKLLQLPYG